MVTELHHAAVIASSEASVDFYRKLGFSVENRIKREKDTVVVLSCGKVRIELFIDPKYPYGEGREEQSGVRFLSLTVSDFECAAEIFGASEYRSDWNGHRYFMIKDPDGNKVQIHE